jgi:hypothetical protein
MIIPDKYSYMDWWSGKICLTYSTILVSPNSKEDDPIIVSWDDIKESDVPRIKDKQKDIFNNAVNIQLEIWKEAFQKRYANSKLRERILENELKKFSNIMLEPMPRGVYTKLENNRIYFDYHSLSAIKKYISDTKENGLSFEFDFVHSPNCLKQINGTIPEVYAECCWEYVKWLDKFQSTLDNKENLNENENSVSNKENETKELKNPFPIIFKNGYAYDMFLELKKNIVLKKTELADYSFIYRKMKHDDSQAINSSVTHSAYIRFLNEKQNAEITSPKLTTAKTSRKEQIYNTILEKYKGLI